jgi:hypothetical protein
MIETPTLLADIKSLLLDNPRSDDELIFCVACDLEAKHESLSGLFSEYLRCVCGAVVLITLGLLERLASWLLDAQRRSGRLGLGALLRCNWLRHDPAADR